MRPLTAAATLLALASAASADPIDDYVRAQLAKHHIPGLSLAVVRAGRVEKLQSYGVADLEWSAAATDDTRYQLASATKPFTGTLLMHLVERGELDLDVSVSRYLPEAPPTWKTITLRHLAAHTSGLKEVDASQARTTEAIAAAAMREPLAFEPGSRSVYGFTDYVVLARILEKVSGKSFPDLLRERLTGPLGMTATGFDHATQDGPIRVADVMPRRAATYRWNGSAQQRFDFLYEVRGYAAGGLYSSASDLARFFSALAQGKVLEPESLAAMWTPPTLAAGGEAEFAAGWVAGRHQGRATVGHSGGPALADLLYFPDEKLAVVVLLNQQRMFPYLALGIADLLLPPGAVPPAIPDSAPALTRGHRALLAAAAEGKVEGGDIAENARPALTRTLQEMGPIVLGMLDPIGAVELVQERKDASRWTRTYRVTFGRSARYWRFDLTPDGRIAGLQPVSERALASR
jgi:CubicO group peptidase (beta-lactamase class C family)